MAKKSLGSSAHDRRAKKSARVIPDSEIDFSDLPELSDEQLAVMKPLGRPLIGSARRKLIAVRIDPLVLDKLRKEAKRKGTRYQSLINEVLAKYVGKRAA